MSPIPPWSKAQRRFGIKLGGSLGDKNQSLSWSVLDVQPPPATSQGEIKTNDPIGALIEQYRAIERDRGAADGVDLYSYDEDTFHTSRDAREGGTLSQHRAMLREARRRLSEARVPYRMLKG